MNEVEGTTEQVMVGREAYLAAMAAYAVIRTTTGMAKATHHVPGGERPLEDTFSPSDYCDFVCDVEKRVKHALYREELILWQRVLDEPDRYPELPEFLQEYLGNLFIKKDLGTGGHYKRVYFNIKRESDRRKFTSTTTQEGSDS